MGQEFFSRDVKVFFGWFASTENSREPVDDSVFPKEELSGYW